MLPQCVVRSGRGQVLSENYNPDHIRKEGPSSRYCGLVEHNPIPPIPDTLPGKNISSIPDCCDMFNSRKGADNVISIPKVEISITLKTFDKSEM